MYQLRWVFDDNLQIIFLIFHEMKNDFPHFSLKSYGCSFCGNCAVLQHIIIMANC